ncbi:hypothetical protein DM01DRAFT_2728 [Hesseltinella vesiculosa]|uniref:Uncharacterized protein n=1 Tax=Hesseltinella vesiculosa TaxID=101127 RepID=A0A1X2GCI7_9FUNG|nr:hypothetical protein DM01DRAFT_2728 [Hesseltinella vesiculosa]
MNVTVQKLLQEAYHSLHPASIPRPTSDSPDDLSSDQWTDVDDDDADDSNRATPRRSPQWMHDQLNEHQVRLDAHVMHVLTMVDDAFDSAYLDPGIPLPSIPSTPSSSSLLSMAAAAQDIQHLHHHHHHHHYRKDDPPTPSISTPASSSFLSALTKPAQLVQAWWADEEPPEPPPPLPAQPTSMHHCRDRRLYAPLLFTCLLLARLLVTSTTRQRPCLPAIQRHPIWRRNPWLIYRLPLWFNQSPHLSHQLTLMLYTLTIICR